MNENLIYYKLKASYRSNRGTYPAFGKGFLYLQKNRIGHNIIIYYQEGNKTILFKIPKGLIKFMYDRFIEYNIPMVLYPEQKMKLHGTWVEEYWRKKNEGKTESKEYKG